MNSIQISDSLPPNNGGQQRRIARSDPATGDGGECIPVRAWRDQALSGEGHPVADVVDPLGHFLHRCLGVAHVRSGVPDTPTG